MIDGDLRMLGAADGFAHALVEVRRRIGYSTFHPIPKHHHRRIKARERELRPLQELERWLHSRHSEVKEAYEKTRRMEAIG